MMTFMINWRATNELDVNMDYDDFYINWRATNELDVNIDYDDFHDKLKSNKWIRC